MDKMEMEAMVTRILLEAGIPARLKGFRYLREAVLLCAGERTLFGHLTKAVYPKIAASFATRSICVERSIRNAIEVAWSRGDLKRFLAGCGVAEGNLQSRPTNSECITLFVEKLRMQCEGTGAARL